MLKNPTAQLPHPRPWQIRIRRAQALQLLGLDLGYLGSQKLQVKLPCYCFPMVPMGSPQLHRGDIFQTEAAAAKTAGQEPDGTAKAVLQEAMLGAMSRELNDLIGYIGYDILIYFECI